MALQAFEAKAYLEVIDFFKTKIKNKFLNYDERFLLLNETKHRMSAENEMVFNEMASVYLKVKGQL